MLAVGVPSSFFSSMVAAVAVYFTSLPPIWMLCLVGEIFSSGGGVFFSSLPGAAACAGGFAASGAGWAQATAAAARNMSAVRPRRLKSIPHAMLRSLTVFSTLEEIIDVFVIVIQ